MHRIWTSLNTPPITRNMHRQRRETNAPCYSSTSHRHLTHRDTTPPFEHARSPEIRRNGTGEARIRPACPIGLYAIRLQTYSCCVCFYSCSTHTCLRFRLRARIYRRMTHINILLVLNFVCICVYKRHCNTVVFGNVQYCM